MQIKSILSLLTATAFTAASLVSTSAIAQKRVEITPTATTPQVTAANPTEGTELLGGYGVANVGFYSDYSFRGVSQTDNFMALQGGFDFVIPAAPNTEFYAGVWGSNVEFVDSSAANSDDEADLEVDLYAGFNHTIGDLGLTVGAIYYTYPGADDTLDYDYYEFSAGASYDFGAFIGDVSVNYSPEYFGDTGEAYYYHAGVEVPLPYDVTLGAGIGHLAYDEGAQNDYTDWNVTLGYNFLGLDWSLSYINTEGLDNVMNTADERFVAGVAYSF